jgi:hypothetical protein
MPAIRYIEHTNIDKAMWDRTIADSTNGFIYSRSFFLDNMCEWDALVMGEYEYVMPLPFRKKAGFKYIYTPFFTGQLGISGINKPTDDLSRQFLEAIPASFSFVDLQLNEYNHLNNTPGLKITERVNYVIDLNQSYELIYADFNKDARKNLRQAAALNLTVKEYIEPAFVFDLYKKAYGHLNKNITTDDYNNFYSVCLKAIELNNGMVMGIQDAAGEILTAAFFAIDNKRIYYLLGAPTAKGKKANATHLLIDSMLKKYAGHPLVFDFEGSDIPSVADFYKKFGPQKRSYQQVMINRLPFWIRWLKRK